MVSSDPLDFISRKPEKPHLVGNEHMAVLTSPPPGSRKAYSPKQTTTGTLSDMLGGGTGVWAPPTLVCVEELRVTT